MIYWCARYGDVSAMRYLIAQGERIESIESTIGLEGAAYFGHWRLCEFLLENGADVNRPNAETAETPLHAALCTANRPAYELVVRVLLAAGADRSVKDANGDSPLSWASWHTRPDAVLRLLTYDDFHVRADRGSTFDHGLGWGEMELELLGRPLA